MFLLKYNSLAVKCTGLSFDKCKHHCPHPTSAQETLAPFPASHPSPRGNTPSDSFTYGGGGGWMLTFAYCQV